MNLVKLSGCGEGTKSFVFTSKTSAVILKKIGKKSPVFQERSVLGGLYRKVGVAYVKLAPLFFIGDKLLACLWILLCFRVPRFIAIVPMVYSVVGRQSKSS